MGRRAGWVRRAGRVGRRVWRVQRAPRVPEGAEDAEGAEGGRGCGGCRGCRGAGGPHLEQVVPGEAAEVEQAARDALDRHGEALHPHQLVLVRLRTRGRGRGLWLQGVCRAGSAWVGGGGTHGVDERDVGDRLVLRHLRPLLGVDLHGEGGACGVSGGARARSAGRPAQARPRTSLRVVPCSAGCSSVTGIRLALRRARVRHS